MPVYLQSTDCYFNPACATLESIAGPQEDLANALSAGRTRLTARDKKHAVIPGVAIACSGQMDPSSMRAGVNLQMGTLKDQVSQSQRPEPL